MGSHALTVAVLVWVFQEQRFVYAVHSEGACSYSKAWESSLESIPSGERASVSPCFTVENVVSHLIFTLVVVISYALRQGSFALSS